MGVMMGESRDDVMTTTTMGMLNVMMTMDKGMTVNGAMTG